MKIQFKILAVALVAGLIAAPAFADDYDEDEGGGAYVALSIGHGIINHGCAAGLANCYDNRATAYFATFGYQFTPMWALEANYGRAGYISSATSDILLLTLSVSGVATVHMTDSLAAFAKAGVTYGDFRASSPTAVPYNINPSGYSPSGGVGLRFNFTPHLSLRLEGDYLGSYSALAGAPQMHIVAGTAGLMWQY